MFFALGLLVFPSELGTVATRGTVLALVVAFVARPLAAFLATAMERFSYRERLVLGWAGLRGAVPVVLATFPVIAGIPRSMEFFNIVFFARARFDIDPGRHRRAVGACARCCPSRRF